MEAGEWMGDEVEALPPGFRFHPTGEEIIMHYLVNKLKDAHFASLLIGDVDLNNCEPWDLPKKAKMGENEWFFYYQKDRKYSRGKRTNRATKLGYWKATGKDKEIYKKGNKSCLVGMKKTLVFYKGRAPKGERSNWVMHEYRLEGNFSEYNFSKTAKEEWVVCRVFHKKSRSDQSVEIEKLESYFADSPTLPPLTDYSCSTERPPTNEESVHQDFKPNISLPKFMSNNNNNIMNQLRTSQPDQNKLITAPGPYLDQINRSPPGGADSTIFAPDCNINEVERMCKMGTFSSFNNSMISPSSLDDLLKACDEGTSMPDLESLWS